jgi:hypothetical protein
VVKTVGTAVGAMVFRGRRPIEKRHAVFPLAFVTVCRFYLAARLFDPRTREGMSHGLRGRCLFGNAATMQKGGSAPMHSILRCRRRRWLRVALWSPSWRGAVKRRE